jgi:sulfate permease, SulP family
LYGYAAVIFNHPVFKPHMNALSKLVVLSSAIHQLGFILFSSLDFSIGMVQDAGLIFLSSMSNHIANRILQDRNVVVVIVSNDDDNDDSFNNVDDATEKIILSTTCVFLSAGTALLGLILILMGKFKLANAVSYLPMPVVGGYLAFIGYFCCQAGVALCISQPLVSFYDWTIVIESWHNLLLAFPGLLAGAILALTSRRANNDAMLPLAMVAIPTVFYIIIFASGVGLDGARAGGWVGQVAPPVPVKDLFGLIDLKLVQWDVVGEVLWTWVGMVFVVSFASCLDVAAISMDMGQALDTNRELTTVGICNCTCGLVLLFCVA